jgi:pimeloyl-ACP methyl ester carboxylesterase
MNGTDLRVLGRRLAHHHGFDVDVFAYPSRHGDAATITAGLMKRVRERAARGARVHLVGHSLGGAFVYRALTEVASPRAVTAVVLGSPLNGCRAAENAAHRQPFRTLIGPHVLSELAQPAAVRHWQGGAALGAIAGCRSIGLGRFFAHFDEDNDGTVAVSETIIPGLADHLVLRHSHIGMLFAADVAEQVAHFLRNGAFRRLPG